MPERTLFPDLAQPVVSHSTGILPSQAIKRLIDLGQISASLPIERQQIQPASIDLRLGTTAYRIRASFLPNSGSTVLRRLRDMEAHNEAFPLDLSSPVVLERDHVYLIQLMESLSLPSEISARANPKSTTGRLDVFTRLITDYGTQFERVSPGYKGPLYVEVVPRTFSVIVRAGSKLNQLRLMRGSPSASDRHLNSLHSETRIVYSEGGVPRDATIARGLWLSIDLEGEGQADSIVGYRSRIDPSVIDFDKRNEYPALDYWDPIRRADRRQLLLIPEFLYILASKERIRIPPSHAAEMVPYDSSFGEFRVHYAGFFDPGFGYGNDDILGTRAVLEVRSYSVPCVLEDGQVMARLTFERLTTTPEIIYGQGIGSSYQGQDLRLGRQFKPAYCSSSLKD
jgi:dCTP deaminase